MMRLLAKLVQRKAEARPSPAIVLSPGQPSWTPRDYASLSREGYERNPYVFAALRLLATSAAGVPWLLYRNDGDELVELPRAHPLLGLLRRPNPGQGGGALIQQLVGYYALAGNAYLLQVGPTGKPPRELYVLRPDRVKVIPSDQLGMAEAYEYTGLNGKKTRYSPDDVLHLKSWHPTNDVYGLPPLEAAAYSVDANNEARAWNKALLENGAAPRGGLKVEGELSENAFERLRTQLRELFSGSKNAGKPVLLESGIDWVEMGMSPRDMDWTAGMKLSAREIATVFGVPPELIGDHENATYANFQEARKAFYTETILPLLDWLRDELNNWLTPRFGDGLYLDYDDDNIEALQEDRNQVWERVLGAVDRGVLTINEARDAVGYSARPEGDVLLVPATLLPVQDSSPDGAKALNLDGERKLQYWKAFDRRREGYELAMQKRVATLFDEELRSVLEALPDGEAAVMQAIGSQYERWLELVSATYLAVGQEFASEVYDQVKARSPTKGREQKLDARVFARRIADWLKVHAGKKITNIQDTTRAEVRKQLAEGVDAGEGVPELAARMRAIYSGFRGPRAEMIARTEVVGASNLGAHVGAAQVAEDTGLTLRKVWLATPDARTRDHHAAADGQKRDMDEPFLVGGAQLQFPGDSSLGAPAAEVINCRCTQTYEVVDE